MGNRLRARLGQDNPRPGEERGDRRTAASSVLLPIRVADGSLGYRNGSVLVAGGPEGSSYASRVDGYDPVQNSWGIIGDMGVARTHVSAVVLPDADLTL